MIEIKVRCKGSINLALSELNILQDSDDFQLKELSKKNFEKLRKSIERKGFWFPFFVWFCEPEKKWYFLDGTQRDKALLWMSEQSGQYKLPAKFPCSEIEAKNKKEAAEAILIQSSSYGQITDDGLYGFSSKFEIDLQNIEEIQLPDFDFDKFEQGYLIDSEPSEKDDEVPEIDKENVIAKTGDLWLLGEHRLLCGDATKREDVERLMDGQKADLLFTDPPYGVDYSGKNEFLNKWDKGNRNQRSIKNDDNLINVETAFLNAKNVLADYSSYYIFSAGGGELMMMMMMMMNEAGLPHRHMIVWVKNNHVLGRTDYNYKHEPIHYGWANRHKFFGQGQQKFSVWNYDKPLKSELHPTMKPVELIQNAILNSTQSQNNIVIDLFLGSGSTLIACEKTNRKCYGIEIEPHYCDVIIKRWQDYTGKESMREDGKKFNELMET